MEGPPDFIRLNIYSVNEGWIIDCQVLGDLNTYQFNFKSVFSINASSAEDRLKNNNNQCIILQQLTILLFFFIRLILIICYEIPIN